MIMSRKEREDLAKLIRQRERLAKTVAGERSAQLLADFEQQLDRKYAYDEDEVWSAATAAANEVVAQARARIRKRCRELGIPPEFAPDLEIAWHSRGRNAVGYERGEMRRIAKRRIEQIEASARLEIERASVAAQERLLMDGLTSDAAREFVDALPSVEQLMPLLTMEAAQQKLLAKKPLRRDSLEIEGEM